MIKRMLTILLLTALMAGCSNPKQNNNQDQKADSNPSSQTILKVNQVMNQPAHYTGKKITVEGVVTHVCEHGGKRLHLSPSGSDVKLRVRTGKGLQPFKREIVGSTVQITGLFEEERLDQQYLNQLKKGQEKSHDHDAHQEDASSEGEQGEKAAAEQGQVSQAYIEEMEQKIKNSEKGYISEYWLTAENISPQ